MQDIKIRYLNLLCRFLGGRGGGFGKLSKLEKVSELELRCENDIVFDFCICDPLKDWLLLLEDDDILALEFEVKAWNVLDELDEICTATSGTLSYSDCPRWRRLILLTGMGGGSSVFVANVNLFISLAIWLNCSELCESICRLEKECAFIISVENRKPPLLILRLWLPEPSKSSVDWFSPEPTLLEGDVLYGDWLIGVTRSELKDRSWVGLHSIILLYGDWLGVSCALLTGDRLGDRWSDDTDIYSIILLWDLCLVGSGGGMSLESASTEAAFFKLKKK